MVRNRRIADSSITHRLPLEGTAEAFAIAGYQTCPGRDQSCPRAVDDQAVRNVVVISVRG